MSLIPRATLCPRRLLSVQVYLNPTILAHVSRAPTVLRNVHCHPPSLSLSLSCQALSPFTCFLGSMYKHAGWASYFSRHPFPSARFLSFSPIPTLLLTFSLCVVLRPCLVILLWALFCVFLLVWTHLTRFRAPRELDANADEPTFNGSLPQPKTPATDFPLIVGPAMTLAHANTFGIGA